MRCWQRHFLFRPLKRVTRSYEGGQVGTVGRIQAEPGAPNVIPGRVLLSLEIRDLSADKIMMLYNDMERKARAIEEKTGTEFTFHPLDTTGKPALMDEMIKKEIFQSC